jgi:hypothetical protein
MEHPFAITLDVGTSLVNHTGSWRTLRPEYVHRLPPCNHACTAGEDIQGWLAHASGDLRNGMAVADREQSVARGDGPGLLSPLRGSVQSRAARLLGRHQFRGALPRRSRHQEWLALQCAGGGLGQESTDRRRRTVRPVCGLPPRAARARRDHQGSRACPGRDDAFRHSVSFAARCAGR